MKIISYFTGANFFVGNMELMGSRDIMLRSFSFVFTLLLSLPVGSLCADKYSRNDFPSDFIFGAGTSAYQVEGAANEDGRTPSIWDTFAHAGYSGGGNGDIASDEYHKYKEDVQLMVETGLDAYRFSISWSRLIPNGRGSINPKGLEYYNNLINELLRNGIQPHATLHHYDLPQILEDEYGGWVSRKIIEDFVAYADVCFREFGDRVQYWITINEPNVFCPGGYDIGGVPPSRCSAPFGQRNCSRGNSEYEPYVAAHNILLAHASAVRLYRTRYQNYNGFIGLTVYTFGSYPATDTENDILALQRVHDYVIGWILNPLLLGDYPLVMKTTAGARLPTFSGFESKLVKGSFDFIGLIYYTTATVKDNSNSMKALHRDYYRDMGVEMNFASGLVSDEGHPINPGALVELLEKIKNLYGNPNLILYENGQRTKPESSVNDMNRVEYMHSCIGAVLDAVRKGINIKGYIYWSFMDVFELLNGYKSSYGLYCVDPNDPELKRIPKLSARWYSRFLKGSSISKVGSIQLKNLSTTVDHLFE